MKYELKANSIEKAENCYISIQPTQPLTPALIRDIMMFSRHNSIVEHITALYKT